MAIDFYLDEPIGSQQALDDLKRFTNTNKEKFNIPDEIDLLWIKTLGHNLTVDRIEYTIPKINEAILNPTQIVVIWAVEQNIMLDDTLVDSLNEFCNTMTNPVVFITGLLGNWYQDWVGKTNFRLLPLMYFDFEASGAWENLIDSSSDRTKKFIFMGTKDYLTRKFILSNIVDAGVIDQGYVGYRQLDGSSSLPLAYYSSVEINKIKTDADRADAVLPLPLLTETVDYTEMPRQFLTDSYLNMVTDTFYECPPNSTFLSEKVFNAMLHKQLFMMLSPAHTLSYLRMQGYRTFSGIIDERYDTIENNYERLVAVNDTFIKFVSQPIEHIKEVYAQCVSVIEHNYNRLQINALSFVLTNELKSLYEKTQIK
jgi:hypothetical protein